MALIKEEREDVAIEEAFPVKREETEEHTEKTFIKEERDEVRVKEEDPEEQSEMAFIKEEMREVTVEEDFLVKREDEEQTEMASIKEERRELTIEEFRVKHEDTEEQTAHEGSCCEVSRCGGVQPYMFEPESDPESEDEDGSAPQVPRSLQPVTSWCSCRNCAAMTTEKENICCLEIPQVVRRMKQVSEALSCVTLHPGFEPVCLNVYSLQNALNLYKADYGPLRLRGRHR
ncbi:cilia- and flagella-associated protein 251-like isoform X4 [Puntigrus tetrazona]|nr:cilia- and flagella-associated protein 251-like isoform X4 [Puntigrus tetrazona]